MSGGEKQETGKRKKSLRGLIFSRSAITIVAVSVVCILVCMSFLYSSFLDETQDNLKSEALYIAAGVEQNGLAYLRSLPVRSDVRITWIGADGQVIFDTQADPALMDNHADRPEVLAALESGQGSARRISGTLADWVIYQAVRIADGSVVRLCLLERSPMDLLRSGAVQLLLLLLAALVTAVLTSANMGRRIVAPINKIDLRHPDSDSVYAELEPLTARIEDQNRQIREQIRQMEETHEAQDKFRRDFTANVSHELKTPLTSISGFAEIIRDGLVQPQDIPHFADTIYQEAQRLILLVGDILKISRMDDQQIPIQKEEVDLYELSQVILERLQPAAGKQGVQLHLSGDHARITGSCQIADEMIYNLCDNAIKYNRPGGRVDVTICPGEDSVLLTVRDTGIGIPQKDQDRVFERFYRVDKTRSQAIGGTGLGLSIVKHGAIFHEARIELDSTPGEGTAITIVFPKT